MSSARFGEDEQRSLRAMGASFDEQVVAEHVQGHHQLGLALSEVFGALHPLAEQTYENKATAFKVEREWKHRGRIVTAEDVAFIRELIAAHAGASRRTLSKNLCEAWDWRQANGAVRDMVCRGLLLMLERAGQIELQRSASNLPILSPGASRRPPC